MCQAFQTLRSNNIATACSLVLLFVFSAIKEPAKELRLSFTLDEKYVNKIFLLFSGSESAEVSPNLTFESRELLVAITPAEDFF